MINIKIFSKDSIINEVIVEGHANYAEESKDIVCAGVSTIVQGTINALDELVKKPIYAYENGYMLIKFENDQKSQLIASTMVIQLKTIEESYKRFVKIKNS